MRAGLYFNPKPSLSCTESHSTFSSLSFELYLHSCSALKHVLAVGYLPLSSPRHEILMVSEAAPMAGMRSLPVMNASSLLWSLGLARSNDSQNHLSVGSVWSGLLVLFPQFSYSADTRSDVISNGSSEPRTSNSISSGRNSERAFPPQTVKKPRLNGSNWRVTAESRRYLTYKSTYSRRFALVTGRFEPPGQRATRSV